MVPSRLRQAVRRLLRARVFAVSALLTLALGIGGTATVFSVVNGVLLRPLPFRDSGRLVDLSHTLNVSGLLQVDQSDASYLLYARENRAFAGVAVYRPAAVNFRPLGAGAGAPAGAAERVAAAVVSPSLFRVLEVQAVTGRGLSDDDAAPGAVPVAVIGRGLWRRAFAADPGIVGRRVEVDGVAREIVGVMPEGLRFPGPETSLWIPAPLDSARTNSAAFEYRGVGRLRPGITVQSATADLQRLLPRVPEVFPGRLTVEAIRVTNMQPVVRPLHEVIVGNVARTLWIVLGAVVVLLLIACANVASLFLARAEGRQHELGVRRALGAGRTALLGEYLTEAALLCAAGGALGLLVGAEGLRLLRALPMSTGIPRLNEVGLDWSVAAFTLLTALLAAVLVSAMPVIRANVAPLTSLLGAGGRSSTPGRERQRARRTLVVVQVALALTLLAGAGLLVQSLARLRAVDPGFDAESNLAFRLTMPGATHPTAGEVARSVVRTLAALAALPGVEAAGVATKLPLDSRSRQDSAVFVEDHPPPPGTIPSIHNIVFATPGYFRAMGMPLVAGRSFADPDPSRSPSATPHEVVVSLAFAQRFWTAEQAIGKRIRTDPRVPWSTIVGVVGDVRDDALERPPAQLVYAPLLTEGLEGASRAPRDVAFVVRTRSDPAAQASSVRTTVEAKLPGHPLYRLMPLRDLLADAMSRTSFTLLLLGLAGIAATVVGATGIYGVIAYLVSLRERELGVRLALGAEPAHLRRLVVRLGVMDTGIGIVVGLAGAVALTRALATVTFGVHAADPAALGGAALLLLLTALIASWAPARRAGRLDPAAVLRSE